MGNAFSLASQILIALAVAVPAILVALFNRRKTSADVQVSLSSESREWVKSFVDARDRAETAARDAAESAREANRRADRAERQVENCHTRVDDMERHMRRLERIMRDNGLTPPTPPWETQDMPRPEIP